MVRRLAAGLAMPALVGVTSYRQSADTVIATARKTGSDRGVLTSGGGAIADDRNGCQGWIKDDGVEGYSGRRYDPDSGLPICNKRFPPGIVIRNDQTGLPGVPGYVPVGRR